MNARACALWNRDEIYKHDLHALLADGAKDGCHTDVGTKLREQLIQLHTNVAMLRAALLAEIIYPETGPACQEHIDMQQDCRGCSEQRVYVANFKVVREASHAAIIATNEK